MLQPTSSRNTKRPLFPSPGTTNEQPAKYSAVEHPEWESSQPTAPRASNVDITHGYQTPERDRTFLDLNLQSIVTTCAKHDNPLTHQPAIPETEQSDACPPWAMQMMKQMTSLQLTTTTALDDLKSTVSELKGSITAVSSRVSNIEATVNKLSCLPTRVDELEKTASFISDSYDAVKGELEHQYKEIRRLQDLNKTMSDQISDLGESKIKDQERSMKQNLMFFGLPESDNENTEQVLHDFMKTKLPSIKDNLPLRFERAHRFGSKKSQPRPIVCRFSFFKDRELVRNSSKDLRHSNFSIKEQLPREVVNRRKILHKKFQEARQQNRHATLHRDILVIEGTEYKVNQNNTIYETGRTFRPRSDKQHR